MRRSSVVLPQPLGPSSDTISPAATESERCSSTGVMPPSAARKLLLTSWTRSDAASPLRDSVTI